MEINRRMFAASVATAAVGLAALEAVPAFAATSATQEQMLNSIRKMYPGANMALVKETMMRMAENHLVKCYGINAIGRNDCAAGAHSCAGQATIARDPNSFVLLPVGDCQKIAGGSYTPRK
ncbi:MAG: BufA1 family periplasmic bufferin-type metallophore [Acetobacteraceae bacterium]